LKAHDLPLISYSQLISHLATGKEIPVFYVCGWCRGLEPAGAAFSQVPQRHVASGGSNTQLSTVAAGV